MAYDLIAAVDLGSNSFRLEVGRIVGDQIYTLDSLKEAVRLGAGLTAGKTLDGASQLRALEALRRFGERLRGLEPGQVRAVATNALRVAKNAAQFLEQAEAALGFPIEVVAGREEARLIYVGVSHAVPDPALQRLVVDIGGGSTEFIIGRQFEPLLLESLYMGCVSFSMQFFPRGKLDRKGFREAELAARRELQTIVHPYRELGWEQAVGSSGSAKAIRDMIVEGGLGPAGDITRDGLDALRDLLCTVGDLARAELPGLRPDRVPVIPGGLAIMSAVFREFELERMTFSDGALRLGVLYDLLGRYHHQDLRNATVERFMRRYEVDGAQAQRVARTSAALLAPLATGDADEDGDDARFLDWAARLHEIGLSVAHSSYHKHSAYILANADMPGFSKMDQWRLARLVLAHRGKLERLQALDAASRDWPLIAALRVAVILHRAREDVAVPLPRFKAVARGFALEVDGAWLEASPLTAAAFGEETRQWASVGREFRVKSGRSRERVAS